MNAKLSRWQENYNKTCKKEDLLYLFKSLFCIEKTSTDKRKSLSSTLKKTTRHQFRQQEFILSYWIKDKIILTWLFLIYRIPANETLFFIVFGLANGPLIWAMFVYRNAVVFHSIDKVTSSYIHYLPPLVSFV